MIEAPPVGLIKLGLQTVHFLAERTPQDPRTGSGWPGCRPARDPPAPSPQATNQRLALIPPNLIELGNPKPGMRSLSLSGFTCPDRMAEEWTSPPVSPSRRCALVDGDACVIQQKRAAKGDGKVTITDQSHAKDLGVFAQGSKTNPPHLPAFSKYPGSW